MKIPQARKTIGDFNRRMKSRLIFIYIANFSGLTERNISRRCCRHNFNPFLSLSLHVIFHNLFGPFFTGLSRDVHRIRCYKIIVPTRVTRMYNASWGRRRRRRRRQWMVEVHPWWRLLRGIVPHLLEYELASSFDLPVISLRLLLPRLLRPSSCHLHRCPPAISSCLPPTRTRPPRPPSPDSSILFRLASLPPSRFPPPLHFA